MWVWSLDLEDPLEEEMVTHCSILAWRIPWTEEPGRLQSMGHTQSRHDWSDLMPPGKPTEKTLGSPKVTGFSRCPPPITRIQVPSFSEMRLHSWRTRRTRKCGDPRTLWAFSSILRESLHKCGHAGMHSTPYSAGVEDAGRGQRSLNLFALLW